jgi:Acyl-CoA dehydrogenases
MENAAELEIPPAAAELTPQEQDLLARARRIADTVLEPNAERYDAAAEFPFANLDALAAEGLVGVTTPRDWGGQGASTGFQREFVETLTAACGTTWFILTQHLGSCSQIAGSENPTLRERFLRDMAAGKHYVGVGFGHLRRPEPMLRAKETPGGWVLNGVAPWVTGWPVLKGVIFGAVLEDGERHLYAYVPTNHPNLLSSEPQALCAMGASATTEVRLEDVFVPESDFVRFSSRAQLMAGDEKNIAAVHAPPLGCAVGSLRLLRAIGEKKRLAPIQEAADALEQEIAACRAEARRWADGPKDIPEYKPNALNARAWAIELGVRAAHMTVAAASGAANALSHPAQRRFREAMFYTVTAQTADIQAATLRRLSC